MSIFAHFVTVTERVYEDVKILTPKASNLQIMCARPEGEAIGLLGSKIKLNQFQGWALPGNENVSFMKCAKHFF